AVPTRVVPTTQPGDLWGPSEELLFFNGLLEASLARPEAALLVADDGVQSVGDETDLVHNCL
ncbi:MAG: hypothetical protein ACI9K5_003579, partial [Gammaproteobacteria bacterium]